MSRSNRTLEELRAEWDKHVKEHVPPEQDEDEEHLGCYSYPNCDIDPLGCRRVMGSNVEPFGHKD